MHMQHIKNFYTITQFYDTYAQTLQILVRIVI